VQGTNVLYIILVAPDCSEEDQGSGECRKVLNIGLPLFL
jgi:hypothetical protein